MPTLTTLIAAALVRLGLQASRDRGWYPTSYYVKHALDALRADDVERAITELGRAWRDKPGEEAEVAREVILMRLDAQADRIAGQEAAARKLRDAAAGEISVLELRLRRLHFNYRPRLAWLTAGAGAAILALMLFSLARLGLHPGIALGGLFLFAAVAGILLRRDHHRQLAAFEAQRSAMSAEVAAEIRILRSEITMREAEIVTARSEHARLTALKSRLPQSA